MNQRKPQWLTRLTINKPRSAKQDQAKVKADESKQALRALERLNRDSAEDQFEGGAN
jgi:hypothetical protein